MHIYNAPRDVLLVKSDLLLYKSIFMNINRYVTGITVMNINRYCGSYSSPLVSLVCVLVRVSRGSSILCQSPYFHA